MSTRVYGARITLNDYYSKVSADAAIGLYNREYDLAANVSAAATTIQLTDSSTIKAGDKATIRDDDAGPEVILVVSNNTGTNTITIASGLTNGYQTADNAKCTFGSEFRWIKNDISGVTTWDAGMLLREGGLGEIVRSADIVEGGNIGKPSSSSIAVHNTEQFWKELDDRSISLIGARAEIVLFTDDTLTVLLDAVVDAVSWDVGRYDISIEQQYEDSNAMLGSVVNSTDYNIIEGGDTDGNDIPITFGVMNPRTAAMIPTDNNVIDAISVDASGRSNVVGQYSGADLTFQWDIAPGRTINTFPCEFSANPTTAEYQIRIRLGENVTWWYGTTQIASDTISLTALDDDAILVPISGSGAGSGSRLITSTLVTVSADKSASGLLLVTLTDYTGGTLLGMDAAFDSWVQFKLLEKMFQLDVWPCYNFVNLLGTVVSAPVIFSYAGETTGIAKGISTSSSTAIVDIATGPDELANYPDDIFIDGEINDANLVNNAAFLQKDLYFDQNVDALIGYVKAYPAVSDLAYNTDAFITMGGTLWVWTTTYPGLYKQSGGGVLASVSATSAGSFANLIDDDTSTSLEYTATITNPSGYIIAAGVAFSIDVVLPSVPDGYEISKAYLGIDAYAEYVSDNLGGGILVNLLHLVQQRSLFDSDIADEIHAATYSNLTKTDDYRLEAWIDVDETQVSKWWSRELTENAGGIQYNVGKSLFEIPNVSNNSDYANVDKLTITFGSQIPMPPGTDIVYKLRFNELAVIFEVKKSVTKKVFTPVHGRIFDSTWGSRVTSADLMYEAPDLLEHIVRLQNWSRFDVEPASGWGKAYATNPKIDTTAFDDTGLDDVRIPYAGQFIGNDTRSLELKKSLCRNAMMLSFVKADGSESVVALRRTETTPTDTITLQDIVSGSVPTILEPDPAKIYCQPTIRYDLDPASGEYKKVISISNVDNLDPSISDATKESYVTGELSGGDAREVWDRCHALYLKAGAIYTAPAYLTDLPWCSGNWGESTARLYLLNWTSWMGLRRVRLEVPSLLDAGSGVLVYQWEIGRRIYVDLPHETNDATIECIVYSIQLACEKPHHAIIEAMMLDDYEDAFDWQETLDATDDQIQETLDATDENIQEVT